MRDWGGGEGDALLALELELDESCRVLRASACREDSRNSASRSAASCMPEL